MSEKKAGMGTAVDWRNEIEVIAGPFAGNRKGWLARAARKAGASYRQFKSLYYGETSNPRHDLACRVLSASQQARINEARRDALTVAEIYRRHTEALAFSDPDFHRPEIDALVEAARIISGRDSA